VGCSRSRAGGGAREGARAPQMENTRKVATQRAFWRLTMALLCLWGDFFCACRTSGQGLPESTLKKATTLKLMLSFVQWPEKQPRDEEGTFQLCVVGDQWLGYALTQETRAASVGGRKIEVKSIESGQDLQGCQVVFVSMSQERRHRKILGQMKGSSALTVGETSGFVSAGGIVEFSFDQDHLRFEINLAAARSAGLKLDARLLAMAKRVVIEKALAGT
jgi:hypothetical protein